MFEIVDKFRSAGYRIWMDNFGNAYPSLNVLNEYTFDELKLDMSFLRPFNLRSKQIVTSIVKMAEAIGLHTLTEDMETEGRFSHLGDIGCEKVQGYLLGKPLPYGQALANLQEKQIQIEPVRERYYYDKIGKVGFLSAVPFVVKARTNKRITLSERH